MLRNTFLLIDNLNFIKAKKLQMVKKHCFILFYSDMLLFPAGEIYYADKFEIDKFVWWFKYTVLQYINKYAK